MDEFNVSYRMNRVAGIVKLALKSNLACGIIVMLLLWSCGRPVIGLFVAPSESQVIDLAVRGARLVSPAFLFNGLNLFAASFFTAVDKPGLSLLVASLRSLFLPLLGILTLPHWLDTDGIWLSVPLADALTAVVVLLLAVTRTSRQ